MKKCLFSIFVFCTVLGNAQKLYFSSGYEISRKFLSYDSSFFPYKYSSSVNKGFSIPINFGYQMKKLDWNVSLAYNTYNVFLKGEKTVHSIQHVGGNNANNSNTTIYTMEYNAVKRGTSLKTNLGFNFYLIKKENFNWRLIPTATIGYESYRFPKIIKDEVVVFSSSGYSDNDTSYSTGSGYRYEENQENIFYNNLIFLRSFSLRSSFIYKKIGLEFIVGYNKYNKEFFNFNYANHYRKNRFLCILITYYLDSQKN